MSIHFGQIKMRQKFLNLPNFVPDHRLIIQLSKSYLLMYQASKGQYKRTSIIIVVYIDMNNYGFRH